MVHNGSVPLTATPQAPALSPEQGAANGRSSGRRRTPKSCDCCGPNSKGHDEKTHHSGMPGRRGAGQSGRGRGLSGRGRGHPGRGRGYPGRGRSLELGDVPRRKPGRPPWKKTVEIAEQVEETKDSVVEEVTDFVCPSPTHPPGEQGGNCVAELVTGMEQQSGPFSGESGPVSGESGSGTAGSGVEDGEDGLREDWLVPSGEEQLEGVCDPGKPPQTGGVMEVEQPPPQVTGAVVLSNGTTPTPPPPPTSVEHTPMESAPMEVEPLTLATVSPIHILLDTTLHPHAVWDHCTYCKPGTWVQEEGNSPPDQPSKPQPWPADNSHEGIREIVHEFLEHFYVKYGSFIPLSESDIMEHLKKTCNSELNNRQLNIHSEVVKYKAGLASAPMTSFMVTYNKHTLTLEDLSTLDEQNWVNDQVINMYGELILEATQHKIHFFNSFFHRQLVAKGYEGVKRWTKKVDLFSKRLLLIPIHLEIHWSLITVDMTNQHINYYDSQGIVFKHTVDNIMRYILSEAKEKKQAVFQKGWKMIINKGIPQQKNDSDCGVFVLEYCRCLALKHPLQFSQDDMPRVRKRIYKELCDCGLTQQH
ncbi:sentrin-specific protease 5 [Osmerus mordax]|uniref:sentrin-specific protease 5 n=1 Tax=Osmerus mordax TaxID=8014 RepID=UPI00350FFC04